MAYITKEEVSNIRKQLTTEFSKKEGWKFSVRKNHNSEVVVVILQAPYNLEAFLGEDTYKALNTYNGKHSNKDLPVSMFQDVQKIITIMKSQEWFDKSDSMTDYFHTAYYLDLKVGEWDKPFTSTGNNNEGQPSQKEKEDADFEVLLNETVAAREAVQQTMSEESFSDQEIQETLEAVEISASLEAVQQKMDENLEAQADRAEQDELVHTAELQEDMEALEEMFQLFELNDEMDQLTEMFHLEETFTAADIDRQEAKAHQEAQEAQETTQDDLTLEMLSLVYRFKIETKRLKNELEALKAENQALKEQNDHLKAEQTTLEDIQGENQALKQSIKNSTRLMEMAADYLKGKEDQPKPDQDPLENTKIFSISKGIWLKQ